MSVVPEADSITLRNRKPFAPPFHRYIAKGKLMDRTCRAGESVIIYDIVTTEPDGEVLVTRATRFQFE